MRALVMVALVGTGCSILVGDDGGGFADICVDWDAQHFSPCGSEPGDAFAFEAGSYTVNTGLFGADPPELFRDGDPAALSVEFYVLGGGDSEVALLSLPVFELPDNVSLRAIGERPLIIASWSTATIDGEIDASSGRDSPEVGAGGNSPACGTQSGVDGMFQDHGGGGGGGGGFRTPGGNGGNGGTGNGDTMAGGGGGSELGTQIPIAIRGGCAGGGRGELHESPGRGPGGGAVEIAAFESISLTGRIIVNGGGGRGGTEPPLAMGNHSGGGGGGSGGWLSFDALSVSLLAGVVTANGGGGGGGSNSSDGVDGGDGRTDAQAADGGSGDTDAGAGGVGDSAASGQTGGVDGDAGSLGGGGGGGGGGGYIVVYGDSDPSIDELVVSSPRLTVAD